MLPNGKIIRCSKEAYVPLGNLVLPRKHLEHYRCLYKSRSNYRDMQFLQDLEESLSSY